MNFCFSLSEVHKDIAARLSLYDENLGSKNSFFELDYSNDINADYIINKTQNKISKASLIVIDYLQLLDEKRTNPSLQDQVEKLKNFAKEKECVILFISQMDRNIENRSDKKPVLADVRLPNPLELKYFNKIIFLHKEDESSKLVDVLFFKPKEFSFKVGWDKSSKFYSL